MSEQLTPTDDSTAMLDALIVGAGFGGLYQLHCLRDRLGLSTLALEAGEGVGGTWYWNRYPGARCDSESHAYCYSFSPELTQEWEWSERYPGPVEILRYLNHVADRFSLKSHIRFNTRVTAGNYDEQHNCWQVQTESGEHYRARYLITAVGCLSSANVPDIEGLSDFAGNWYHSGQWPRDGVDFSGLRVGQIGTGSTGIQAAPVIAEQAAHLTVFQRTANYSVPARNGPLTDEVRRQQRAEAPAIRDIMHTNTNGHPWTIDPRKALDTSAEQRQAIYEKAWQVGGLKFRSAFADLLVSKEANDTAARFIRDKISEIVDDPETARVLSDIDHPYGAKRPPIDTHYFETFNRDNVSLVDLKREPIECITERGIRTASREYEIDAIFFATGFDAMTGTLLRMNITGRNNCKLADAWSAGPSNYLGLQIAGFPNLFTVTGPGSPSVLCNMPVAIEQHVEWITDCIDYMNTHGNQVIETTDEAAQGWVAEVNAAAGATLLADVKHSWYLGANVPGKPRVFMPYAGGMARYRRICDEVASDGYRGFVFKA
jgi:cation diffusion facilitator CzcD-associated flavoprotein CzcO